MFSAVIFDMDGLMFDTERLNAEAWLSVGADNNIPLTHDIVMKVVGLGPEIAKGVMQAHIADLPDYYELREQRIKYVKRHITNHGMPVKRGLRELLAYLKQNGYKIAVATSTPRPLAGYFIETAGLTAFFDQMVFGDMVERAKPAPDIYNKACTLLGLTPERCLTLEDSPVGVKAAWLAGTRPVMIPDLIKPNDETRKMLYALADSLMDVIPLLERVRQP